MIAPVFLSASEPNPQRSAEYWDSPSSKVVELYELAKSITTGKTAYDIGEHAKLNNL